MKLQSFRHVIGNSGIIIKVLSISNNVANLNISNINHISQCNDGIDNDDIIDHNHEVDSNDPSCQENSMSEVEPFECDDGIDNDNDGLIDMDDPECKSWNDYWENV